jgi:hypothetical protein
LLIQAGVGALQYNWFSATGEGTHVACKALVPERYVAKCVLGRPIVHAQGFRVFCPCDGADEQLDSFVELQKESLSCWPSA